MSSASAAIFGCKGTALSEAEADFFREVSPWGFILFARNLKNPGQIRKLTTDLRAAVGRDAPILIDQEGGRVARLKAPQWQEWMPPLDQMAKVKPENARQAMALRYRIIAYELHKLGIDVNCAPMLDIACADSHEIILNRCYGRDVESVAEMGRAVAEGLLAGGVLPVIKHIPGHGRANMDSHFELPRLDTPAEILEETDFVPFQNLSDLPMAMTAHIVYEAFDDQACCTVSPAMVAKIREFIGFDGLLMTDDLSMKALKGSFAERTKSALAAGCDIILHCNGDMEEMKWIAAELPMLCGKAEDRANSALAARITPMPFQKVEAMTRFNDLIS